MILRLSLDPLGLHLPLEETALNPPLYLRFDARRPTDQCTIEMNHATRKALDALGPDDKAVFFCRSGMRSAAAWAMAERLAGAEPEGLRAAAAAAG